MNLDKQIKLLERIHYYSTNLEEDKLYLLNSDVYSLQIVRRSYLEQTSFRLKDISNDYTSSTIMIIRYDSHKNDLVFESIYERLLFLQNITSIIQDYEELDINQFILIHTRKILNMNYSPLEVVLKLLGGL